MPPAMRPFWALHVAGAVALLPEEVRRGYGLRRWPVPRLAIAAAIGAINHGYLLFAPVRRARARMRRVERDLRAQRWSR